MKLQTNSRDFTVARGILTLFTIFLFFFNIIFLLIIKSFLQFNASFFFFKLILILNDN